MNPSKPQGKKLDTSLQKSFDDYTNELNSTRNVNIELPVNCERLMKYINLETKDRFSDCCFQVTCILMKEMKEMKRKKEKVSDDDKSPIGKSIEDEKTLARRAKSRTIPAYFHSFTSPTITVAVACRLLPSNMKLETKCQYITYLHDTLNLSVEKVIEQCVKEELPIQGYVRQPREYYGTLLTTFMRLSDVLKNASYAELVCQFDEEIYLKLCKNFITGTLQSNSNPFIPIMAKKKELSKAITERLAQIQTHNFILRFQKKIDKVKYVTDEVDKYIKDKHKFKTSIFNQLNEDQSYYFFVSTKKSHLNTLKMRDEKWMDDQGKYHTYRIMLIEGDTGFDVISKDGADISVTYAWEDRLKLFNRDIPPITLGVALGKEIAEMKGYITVEITDPITQSRQLINYDNTKKVTPKKKQVEECEERNVKRQKVTVV